MYKLDVVIDSPKQTNKQKTLIEVNSLASPPSSPPPCPAPPS